MLGIHVSILFENKLSLRQFRHGPQKQATPSKHGQSSSCKAIEKSHPLKH